MSIEPHPKFAEIKRELESFAKRGKSFSAVCFRCTAQQYASQVVTGLGSQREGGRWNPKGLFPTVYLCETPETALKEFLARGRRMRIPDHLALPMTMAGVEVFVANLLDLTDADVSAVVNPLMTAETQHWRELQNRREAVSQAIGRAVKEICFGGLIAASHASPVERIIVVFPGKIGIHDRLVALGPLSTI